MSGEAGGLVGNVRGLAANGVRAVRTRLELAEVELQIEKARLMRQGTVKNHVSSILAKFGVRDRTRAVLRALELGLL